MVSNLEALRLNLHLKREILMLASEITYEPGNAEHYIIPREDLRGLDTSVQNQILQLQLELLRDIRRTVQRPGLQSFESRPSSSHMHHDCDSALQMRPVRNGESPKQKGLRRKGTVTDAQRTGIGRLTQRCRSALLCWLMEKAADNTFEPADSDRLIKAACAFLKDEVLTEGQELSTRYARPARFSRVITPRDNLWSAFQRIRSVPAGESHTLSIEHLSTKPLVFC
jgi:hypothetical protein